MNMNVILDMLNEPDPVWTPLLIGLLCWVGSRMIETRPDLRRWGARVAAGVFIVYALYAVQAFSPTNASECVGLTVCGVFAAGLTLGVSWIALAATGLLYELTVGRFREAAKETKRIREKAAREEQWALEDERKAEERRRSEKVIEAPVIPRSERIRASVEQAKADYHSECYALRSAGLDADELDTALVQARTKYLRALKKEVE
jgi:hypothetical protein